MSENEKYLLGLSKKGDIEAFEMLMEKYQKKVFNIALRLLGNYDDASEVTQEVFIRIYKSIGSFKGESQISTWIYRIATNVCLDELRKRKRKWVMSLDEEYHKENGDYIIQVEDDKPTPDVVMEQKTIKSAVKNAIDKLSEKYKLIIILRDIQGFSYEEISEIVKTPVGTVKSRINRARLQLKELLLKEKELFSDNFVKDIERRAGDEKM
ncbi:MAG TPA: sigma-70 family RNA polymerase sigma factor [Pseudobacteroides sp.]|uniref:sigma-70 family RNA polymerase sigma factor n=1 Tax=Pseudobacteroides sp. TaxID=1968840 RepID=UPI002F945257